MKLTKEELNVLIQVLNMPRTQNLQSAQFCINLSNKLSAMLDEFVEKPVKAEKVEEERLSLITLNVGY